MHRLAFLFFLAFHVSARTFKVINNCPYDVWPAISPMTGGGRGVYTGSTGWYQAKGSQPVVQQLPEKFEGRIWGRRACSFDSSGKGSCASGDCSGKLECGSDTFGLVNIVEMNLPGSDGIDYWDFSWIPGYNIPMKLDVSGCQGLDCGDDLLPSCPNDKMKQYDSSGNLVGCLSACFANLDADPGNSNNCCSGIFQPRESCNVNQALYYTIFKSNCPNAYAWPYDDNPGWEQVIFTCQGSTNPTYTLTFCPATSAKNSLMLLQDTQSSDAPLAKTEESTKTDVKSTTLAATQSTDDSTTTNAGHSSGSSSTSGPTNTAATSSPASQSSHTSSDATPLADNVSSPTATSAFSELVEKVESNKPLKYGLIAGAVVLVLAIAGCCACLCMRGKSGPSQQGAAPAQAQSLSKRRRRRSYSTSSTSAFSSDGLSDEEGDENLLKQKR